MLTGFGRTVSGTRRTDLVPRATGFFFSHQNSVCDGRRTPLRQGVSVRLARDRARCRTAVRVLSVRRFIAPS